MTRPDFPRTLAEFQGRFASEEDCRRYLVACRWPDGFRCPRCGEPDAYELAGRELLQCRACRHQTSVTAGTVLHRTRVPLRLWFAAAYLVTTHTPGFSAVQLQRSSASPGTRPPGRCCTSCAGRCSARSGTASRAWSRSTRRTWAASRRGAAAGGGATAASRSSSARSRCAAGARAASGSRWSEDLSAASLVPFVEASVDPGSTVLTDGWQGYAPLRKGYDHRPSTVGDPRNASELFPRVHRTFSNLKTWLQGTHHGVGAKHLPHYVDEFVFRFNRRRTPMAAFQSLLGLSSRHPPTTHKMLYAAELTG